ncbi:MAG TPA: serine protease [Kofleriaceae bacterium]|jgi:S1-C subfamily serine protease|nr:serine protease [Kofleriaceae bacterium]
MWVARFLIFINVVACASWDTGSTGTCFFVSPSGLALTSLHVVKHAHRVYAVDSTGRQFWAEILARDERLDLAAMQVHDIAVPAVLPIAANDAMLGDRVFSISAQISGQRMAEGSIVEQHALGMAFLLGTSAQVERGNSGGPLVDESGEVVGIMTKRRNDSSGQASKLSFAVKASMVREAFGALPIATNPTPLDRLGAVERARRASCLVVTR